MYATNSAHNSDRIAILQGLDLLTNQDQLAKGFANPKGFGLESECSEHHLVSTSYGLGPSSGTFTCGLV